MIRVITIAAVSRQSGRACRLSFAGSKPFRYLDKTDLMLWSNGSWYFGRLPRFVLFHFDFPIFRLNPWGEGATTPLCRLLPDIARSETGQGFRKISAHPQKGTVRFPCPVKKQFPLCGLNARPRISGYPIPLFSRSIAAFHLLCYIPFPLRSFYKALKPI